MEDYLEFNDYMCFSSDKDIKSIIKNEQLFFSDNIILKVTLGISKSKNILLTNKACYYLDGKSKLN